jgi:hypothetical protein
MIEGRVNAFVEDEWRFPDDTPGSSGSLHNAGCCFSSFYLISPGIPDCPWTWLLTSCSLDVLPPNSLSGWL